MDFETDVSFLTDEQVFAYVSNSSYIDNEVKKILLAYKGIPYPPNLSFGAVYARYRSIQRKEAQKEDHLRTRMAGIAATTDIGIMPTQVTYVIDNKPISANIKRGFAVEPGRDTDMIKSHISDAIAYMYTPSTKAGVKADIPNNFEKAPAKAALPTMTVPTQVNPSLWSNISEDNVTYVMSKLTSKASMNAAVRKMETAYASGDLTKTPPFVMTDRGDYMPKAFAPKVTTTVKDCDLAHRVLSAHRAARGQDSRWISSLTANYYYGCFNKAIDRVMWETSDVLSIARMANVSSITVMGTATLNNSTLLSLAANNYPVYVQTQELVSQPIESEDGKVLAGVYRIGAHVPFAPGTLVVRAGPPNNVTVTKSAVIVSDQIYESLKFFSISQLPDTVHSMTWTFMHNKLGDYKVSYYPSMHAHSGHILAYVGPAVLPPCDLVKMTHRFAVSNCFKTWYPLSRVRFMEYDLKVYAVSFPSFYSGFTLRMRAPLKNNRVDYFGSMGVSEVESSLMMDEGELRFNTPIADLPVIKYVPAAPVPAAAPPAEVPVHIVTVTGAASAQLDEEEDEVNYGDVDDASHT